MATLERGADACIKWARTHLKPLRPLEWRVHLGTFSSSQDSTGVQITLTCSKAFRTRGEGSIDRPGRRKFVGTFDECMAWLEPYVRML